MYNQIAPFSLNVIQINLSKRYKGHLLNTSKVTSLLKEYKIPYTVQRNKQLRTISVIIPFGYAHIFAKIKYVHQMLPDAK